MIHRFTGTLAVAAASSLLALGLAGCTDRVDPAAPDRTLPGQPQALAPAPAAATAAIEDALQRLVPAVAENAAAATLEEALGELAAALGQPTAAGVSSALAKAREATDRFADTGAADPADLDALRLALDAATTRETTN